MNRLPKEFEILNDSDENFLVSYKEKGFSIILKRLVTSSMLIFLCVFSSIVFEKLIEGNIKTDSVIFLPIIAIVTIIAFIFVCWFFVGRVTYSFGTSEFSVKKQLFCWSFGKIIPKDYVREVKVVYYGGGEHGNYYELSLESKKKVNLYKFDDKEHCIWIGDKIAQWANVPFLYFHGEAPEVIFEGSERYERHIEPFDGLASKQGIRFGYNVEDERRYEFSRLRQPFSSFFLLAVSILMTNFAIFSEGVGIIIFSLFALWSLYGFVDMSCLS